MGGVGGLSDRVSVIQTARAWVRTDYRGRGGKCARLKKGLQEQKEEKTKSEN